MVEDTETIDHEADIVSKYCQQPKKLEVLTAASLIIWDEALTNHKHCLSTAFSITNDFRGKVLVLMGDWRQTPPVVRNGNQSEIIRASFKCSRYWSMFSIYSFTINQRLLATQQQGEIESIEFRSKQMKYLKMIDTLGDGKFPSRSNTVINIYEGNMDVNGSAIVCLPLIKGISDMSKALDFLFPMGFNAEIMYTRAILSATNVQVDEWNAVIQSLNPSPLHVLCSVDRVKEMDDPNGFLAAMIDDSVLERFQKTGVPHHRLQLKVNDICLIQRTLNRKEGLTTNTRVRILHIAKTCIRVCTMDPTKRKDFNIPRIKFTVALPYGRSLEMERIQFPLRLAYSITYNKSQGQEFDYVLCDIRKEPFTHGHLYVALSRIRIADNIRFFVSEANDMEVAEEEFDGGSIVTNVVYKDLSL